MVNDSVKEILKHKATLMTGSPAYSDYLNEMLIELGIKELGEAALVGAVDAMIYDIACSLDFTKQKREANDWSSYPARRSIIKDLWKKL